MYTRIKTGYKGKSGLRGEHEVIELTEREEIEYLKCLDPVTGPIYFIKEYVKVEHVDHGVIPFKLWDWQEDIVNTCNNNRFVICKVGRQSGKSVTMIAYLLWVALFNETKNIACLAHKEEQAKDLMKRIKTAYELLPKWLQQGVKKWNEKSIELSNGSTIFASATSKSAIRGKAVAILYLDEFAHVEPEEAEPFYMSVFPTISSGKTTKIFITSTPNGMNLYYKVWTEAMEKRNSFVPIEVHWWQVPGRDEAWKKEQIANTNEVMFEQEFGCEFLGSSYTLIAGSKLRSMTWVSPLELKENGTLRIYERPKPGHTYVITCDVATGLGGDAQAFSVIDVSDFPFRQVAVFDDNHLPHIRYPDVIYRIARWYNDAFVLIEINDIGQSVSYVLQTEIGYDNLIKVRPKGKQGQQVSGGFTKLVQYGLKHNTATKRIGCSSLKLLIESDRLIVQDYKTINEFKTFIEDNDSFSADEGTPGAKDDIVMSLVLFGWLADQQFFKDGVGKNIREAVAKELDSIMDEEFVPFGFFSDGQRDTSNVLIDPKETKIDKHPEDIFNWDTHRPYTFS